MCCNPRLWFILIFMPFFLVACGFHLRGDIPLSPELGPMYIDTKTPFDPLVQGIENTLSAYHIELVDSPKSAHTILHIDDIQSSENLISVSASTNTRQYALSETLKMTLSDQKGRDIIPLSTLTATNPLTVDSSQILNASNQKQALTSEMQQALIQQLMTKLASHNTQKALASLKK